MRHIRDTGGGGTMKVLNLYSSVKGNTETVAERIAGTAARLGHAVETVTAGADREVAFLDYDFVFVGCGVYMWLPPRQMLEFLRESRNRCAAAGEILPCSPRRPGKNAVVYCTYGGVHTGVQEALPVVKFCGQLFDHLGFAILDEWYVPGEFRTTGLKHMNTGGRLGDITGRPDERDLDEIAQRVEAILKV